MPVPTLLDIAKANGSDPVVGLVEETTKAAPEISGIDAETGRSVPNVGYARTIRGLQYKTLVRTTLPTVSFRAANEGTAASKGVYENRLVETYMFNPQWEADQMVADAYEDGAPAWIALEGSGILMSSFQYLGKIMYYGTTANGDAKGFPGLVQVVDPTMVVDAAGGAADTGSSVWAVKWGPQYAGWVFGNNGELRLTDPVEARVQDAAGNPYMVYHQEIKSRPGFQVNHRLCVGRIKKLTAEAGKTLTDTMIYDLLALFPVGIKPDVLFMTRRSRAQLRKSRTATNATGAPAPLPTEVEGIPIMVTDSILNTEPLAL